MKAKHQDFYTFGQIKGTSLKKRSRPKKRKNN